MDKIIIKGNMLDILSKIKGKIFLGYECDLEEKWNRTYGFLRLYVDDKYIDISNQQFSMNLFGEKEDVACFEVFDNSNKTIKESFNLIDAYSSQKIDINEIIENVYILSEYVEINKEKIEMDMGIVIKTNKHEYCISRETWFDEFIYINIDKDFDNIYLIDKDKEDWLGKDSDDIKIIRFKKEI